MAISRRFFLLLALLAALPARPALAAAVPPPAGGAGGAQQQQQQPPAGQQGSPSSSAPPLNDCPDCGKVGVTNVPESGGKSAAVSASSVGLPANVDLQEDVLGVLPQRQVCFFPPNSFLSLQRLPIGTRSLLLCCTPPPAPAIGSPAAALRS